MATWLKPLLLALGAALLLHLLSLIGIGSQMQSSGSVLTQNKDPLFTRTIEAASPQAEAPAPPPEPPAPAPRAPRAAVPPSLPALITESVALLPEPIIVIPTAAASTPAILPGTTSVDIKSTPSQSLSAQPTGLTDSLLITGEWPGDTRLSYTLSGYLNGDLFGSGQVQWTREGTNSERYQVRVTVDAGLYELRMTSQGRVSPAGLLPEAFEEYSKRIFGSPRIRLLKLEAEELLLEGERRVPRPAVDPLSVQDAVSQFIDLGHRFSQGRAKLEAGQTVRVWLGRPGALDEWMYDIGPAETLILPRIGPVIVHLLKPRPIANPRGTITLSMWLAPSLQYLPAKIRIDLNAQSFVELVADQLQQR